MLDDLPRRPRPRLAPHRSPHRSTSTATGRRRPHPAAIDPLWDERAGHYELGGGGVAARPTRTCCSSTRSPRSAATSGPARQRPPRAPDRRRARRLPAVRRERAAALDGRADARARARVLDAHDRAPTSTCGRQRDRRRAALRVARAPRARALRRRRRPRSPTASTARAMGSYWRWPTIRLNQINWYALVYAANATVTGSPRLLRRDLRLQIARFVAGRAGAPAPPATSGPACASTTCRTSGRARR